MKAILLFFFLSGCGLNESLVNSIGEQAKDVIDKAKSQGGQKGIQTLNDEIEDLEEKIDKKESEYRRLKNRIDDKEEELDEKQDELDDVEKRLREIEDRLNEGGLTPEEVKALKDERDRLQGEKTTLEQEKQRLQDQITGLNTDKEQLEAERDQAKADLEAVKEARDDLQRKLDKAIKDRDRARRERDSARADEQTQRDRARTAEEQRKCWKRTSFDVCGIKDKIQVAIRQALSNKPCGDTNICDLEGITRLNLKTEPQEQNSANCEGNLELSPADFKNFKSLEELDFRGTCLRGLTEYRGSDGFFKGLTSLRWIDLSDTNTDRLSPSFFNNGAGVILENLQEVIVSDFGWCSSSPPPYKEQLEGEDENGQNIPYYCY